MQREDWKQIYTEVERQIHGLIVKRQIQIEQAFRKNQDKLTIAFAVALEEKDAGFDVDVDITFVLEKIKEGDHARLILGQMEIPGTERSGKGSAAPVTVRVLGAAKKPKAARRRCDNCKHGDADGCNHPTATAETCGATDRALWQKRRKKKGVA